MKNAIEIVNGPSGEELFLGLRLIGEKRLVPFEIINGKKQFYVLALMQSIQAEDGSGESWNITFLIDKKFLDPVTIQNVQQGGTVAMNVEFETVRACLKNSASTGPDAIIKAISPANSVLVKAHYSSKTRQGVLRELK
jgi:hypothetical protein